MPLPATHIKAILFDYGMVLSGPPNPLALQQMLDATSLPEPVFQQHYWAHRHDYDRDTLNMQTYWQTVADDAGIMLTPAMHQKLLAADIKMWTDLNQPMVTWAEHLIEAGYKTGILSNIGDGMSPWLVANFPWLGGFHHLTWSWELKLAKPEGAIYHHAVQGLECEPGEVLFVDDKEENIAAAQAEGLRAVLYSGHDDFVQRMHGQGFGGILDAVPIPQMVRR